MRQLATILLGLTGFASLACGPPEPQALYVDLGCPRCHGFQLQGNRYGPALNQLDEKWEAEETISAYLRDPKSIIETNPRLKAQDAGYSLKMQPVTDASDEDLAILSRWLLSRQ